MADADLVVVRRVEHEDVATCVEIKTLFDRAELVALDAGRTFKFELVAVRARLAVDGAVALALVAEATRENLRVANRSLWSPQG